MFQRGSSETPSFPRSIGSVPVSFRHLALGVALGATVLLIFGCTVATSVPAERPSVEFDAAFWAHWGDGRAELSAYELSFPRYGEVRPGIAVAIFVTEPFSAARRVKVDRPAQDSAPIQVMKLNLIRDFPTGIYDYNVMTSTFVALEPFELPAGSPAKISFSAQEWCGHVYAQMLVRPDRIDMTSHSYFFDEADEVRRLSHPEAGVTEDVLLHWARGWAAPELSPGDRASVALLTSLLDARVRHEPVEWVEAELERRSGTEMIEVPAGRFETQVRIVRTADGASWTFWVETAEPRRIIRWERSDGERAELLGSQRFPYWTMNGGDFRTALEQLGLSPREPRMP